MGESTVNTRRWVCIYPTYINSRKTVAEGRRIPKTKAVDTPTSGEIRDVLSHVGLDCVTEDKMYPRDPGRDKQFQGRVRINMRRDDGTPVNADLPSRMSLYLYTAEHIPKLKSRVQKAGGQPDTAGAQAAQAHQFPPAKGGKKKAKK